ncbi:hypothetical protein Pmani_022979 [Petrolisthes manimaculis]|uniref:Kelch domain-containing protein 10 n=1 Tax=Petrolisthes manimaculis TaxID=1843537 RepID=A0AAE1U023_9EUCA|nr:hypothetical protein Pmani_022979 [Petrolisthes manimaculis]
MDERYMDEVATWAVEDNYPGAVGRSGHRLCCCDSSFLYCVGGYNSQHGLLQEVWRLNLSTSEWEQVSDCSTTPSVCVSHCLVSSGGHLLMLGGTTYPFGSVLTNEVEACDQLTGQWQTLHTTGNKPPSLYGQAARRAGEYVYTVGGTSGYHFSFHAHALHLHLPTLTWTTLAKPDLCKQDGESPGRYRAEIGVLDGKVVVVGGTSAFTVFSLDQLPVLDVRSGQWELQRTHPDPITHAHPAPRRSHAAVQMNNDLYVIGGTDGMTVYDDVWRLHLPSLTWTRHPLRLPTPLYFHDAALTQNGILYVYGGLSSVGSSQRSSALYRAKLQAQPLLEVAWDAFTLHCPTITSSPALDSHINHEYLAAGVPRNLMKRLAKLPKTKCQMYK